MVDVVLPLSNNKDTNNDEHKRHPTPSEDEPKAKISGHHSDARNYIKCPWKENNRNKPKKHKLENPDVEEAGEIKKRDEHNIDFLNIVALVRSGRTLKQLREDHSPVVKRYRACLQRHAIDFLKNKKFKQYEEGLEREVHIVWGKKCTDRTRFIGDKYTAEEVYKASLPKSRNQRMWWDGYDGQTVILLDDFKGQISLRELKCITDRMCHAVEVRRGFTHIVATHFYITSNLTSLEAWYPCATPPELAALRARIASITLIE
jgi:hypothetical protein